MKNFFETKKFDRILLFSLIFFLLLLIGIVIYSNVKSSPNMPDLLGDKCLESCKDDSVNFDWDLLSYTINESEGKIQCDCVRKSEESAYDRRVRVETKTVYLDLQTFEKIKS